MIVRPFVILLGVALMVLGVMWSEPMLTIGGAGLLGLPTMLDNRPERRWEPAKPPVHVYADKTGTRLTIDDDGLGGRGRMARHAALSRFMSSEDDLLIATIEYERELDAILWPQKYEADQRAKYVAPDHYGTANALDHATLMGQWVREHGTPQNVEAIMVVGQREPVAFIETMLDRAQQITAGELKCDVSHTSNA